MSKYSSSESILKCGKCAKHFHSSSAVSNDSSKILPEENNLLIKDSQFSCNPIILGSESKSSSGEKTTTTTTIITTTTTTTTTTTKASVPSLMDSKRSFKIMTSGDNFNENSSNKSISKRTRSSTSREVSEKGYLPVLIHFDFNL